MLRFLQALTAPKSEAASVGSRAEREAADWLCRERGFAVLTRNWRNPRDEREEIDLVCRDGEVLVFVEVKARAADALVPGYFAVDKRKKRVLLSVTRAYLARLRPKPLTFRFDIVEVAIGPAERTAGLGSGRTPPEPKLEIRHFENVPLFPKRFQG